jgi:hypothetical protein
MLRYRQKARESGVGSDAQQLQDLLDEINAEQADMQ